MNAKPPPSPSGPPHPGGAPAPVDFDAPTRAIEASLDPPNVRPADRDDFTLFESVHETASLEVWRAADTRTKTPVLFKIRKLNAPSTALVARLYGEAAAAAGLDHPAFSHVVAVGRDGDAVFVAEQVTAAISLRELLRRSGGRVAVQTAAAIADHMLEALVALHREGVVHRDLGTSTVWLDAQGVVRLSDVGIGSPQAVTDVSLRRLYPAPGAGSPEQANDAEATAQSDLFALGLVLYELLGAVAPYRQDDATLARAALANDPPPALIDFAPWTPPPLLELVAWLTAPRPIDRCPSAKEARALLLPYLHSLTAEEQIPLAQVVEQPAEVRATLDRALGDSLCVRADDLLARVPPAAAAAALAFHLATRVCDHPTAARRRDAIGTEHSLSFGAIHDPRLREANDAAAETPLIASTWRRVADLANTHGLPFEAFVALHHLVHIRGSDTVARSQLQRLWEGPIIPAVVERPPPQRAPARPVGAVAAPAAPADGGAMWPWALGLAALLLMLTVAFASGARKATPGEIDADIEAMRAALEAANLERVAELEDALADQPLSPGQRELATCFAAQASVRRGSLRDSDLEAAAACTDATSPPATSETP